MVVVVPTGKPRLPQFTPGIAGRTKPGGNLIRPVLMAQMMPPIARAPSPSEPSASEPVLPAEPAAEPDEPTEPRIASFSEPVSEPLVEPVEPLPDPLV